jgi:hypothetical protein
VFALFSLTFRRQGTIPTHSVAQLNAAAVQDLSSMQASHWFSCDSLSESLPARDWHLSVQDETS